MAVIVRTIPGHAVLEELWMSTMYIEIALAEIAELLGTPRSSLVDMYSSPRNSKVIDSSKERAERGSSLTYASSLYLPVSGAQMSTPTE